MILAVNHPLICLSKEFAQLCKPLELWQIQHFSYLKQFNDGHRICLSNKPEWVDDYFNLNLYQSSLFEGLPSEYKAQHQVWIGDYELDVYQHGKLYYNTSDAISITEPNEDGCEHFIFSAHVNNKWLMHYLANNMDILYHFVLFLKDKGAHLLQKSQKAGIKAQDACTTSLDLNLDIKYDNIYQSLEGIKNEFMNQTPISRMVIQTEHNQSIKLSRQEIQCIIHIMKNKTAKEIARELDISYRTIESYIGNIKTKLDCDSKNDLISLIKNDKYLLSLIPS